MRRSLIKRIKAGTAMVFFLLTALGAFAQQVITGTVTDSKSGDRLSGVTVAVKGELVATQTGADGRFSINAGPQATLVFTSVNYAEHEEPVAGRSTLVVQMTSSSTKLSEVVVIGYGTTRKKDLTGAVTQISTEDFQSGQITSPEQLIAGKVAGVQIVSNGGAPGSGSTIRIRGGASLNASNDPLIVVDGVPLSSEGISGSYSALSLINPNDIETFSVLKDASATAIYGSRASNGVIIITTKKGRLGGKPRVNFNTAFSISDVSKNVAVLSPERFKSIVRDSADSRFLDLLGTASTRWLDEIYQTALSSDNNLSISGGFKNMPYRISVGYLNQEGVLKTGKLERFSGGLNISPRFFDDHLKLDINFKGTISKTRFANQGAIGAAISYDPSKPVYSGNTDYNGYWEWLDNTTATGLKALAPLNPVGLLMDRHDNGEVKRSIGNALIDYQLHFLPDLHAFLNVGYDVALGTGTIFVDENAAQAYLRDPDRKHGGIDNQYKQKREDKLLEAYLNYTKSFSGGSKVEIVGGYAYQNFLTTVYNYPDKTVDGTIISAPAFELNKPQYTLISYYGRANLSWKEKYLLTGTVRTDGSSRFSKENRWGVFPSAAFAWNMKEEGFLNHSKTFSALKLRLGYGITGQQNGIGLYDYNSFYGFSSNESQYELGNQFYHMYAPSGYYPQRTWEQTATYNAGLDFGFANNRITGAVDVYYKKTTDLLNNIAQPAGSNFSNEIVANVGDMENKGIEVSLNLQPVKNASLVWDLNLNGTYNENKITNLTTIPNPNFPGNKYYGISGGTGNTILINSVDMPRAAFYVYKQVYDASGSMIEGLYEDLNRDGIINQNDLYQYKSADPKYLFGLSTNFNIRTRLNLGFVMRGSFGNYMYNNVFSSSATLRNIFNPIGYLNNAAAYNLIGGTGDKFFLSDYYIQNASFVRMDNAYISYNVGKLFNNTADLTVNANMQNVFVITNYVGLDPEIQSGVDNNFYPRPRVITLGLNLNF